MPLGRSSSKAKKMKVSRANETEDQREARQEANRIRNRESRSSETPDHRDERLGANRKRNSESRSSETPDHRDVRLEADQVRHSDARRSETPDHRDVRLGADQVRHSEARRSETPDQREARQVVDRARHVEIRTIRVPDLEKCAFQYNPQNDYEHHPCIAIGEMDKVCQYCDAKKFKNETMGMCCASGKVKLPELCAPPGKLSEYLAGETVLSKHFLKYIRMYNSCFNMTSFGATTIVEENFMPTFKVQGQIYHRAGSLLPLPNEEYKFLQIFFMGNLNEQIDLRCDFNRRIRREIVVELEQIFDEHNDLIKLFKTALERMPADDYKVVVRADKRPAGQHERQYNAPTIDETAIVIVGEDFESRDIVLHRRSGDVRRISETHRSYDALQYPILFCRGEDGYHFEIHLIDPQTGSVLLDQQGRPKKVSSMNYYAYRLMIRGDRVNHLLLGRELYHQWVVDMYAKIESERLLFLRNNQSALRSEEYAHLRDAMRSDGNVDPNELGRMVILPATYIGSPRHMHEYAQDAMTYVRNYGRPDLFITFTCNPAWDEVRCHLYPGQSATHRHDITARVFKQKLKSLIDFIVKYKAFGETRCWMYSIEWQKRGLPHAHILIWLNNKITPDQIDQVISAEIPDKDVDRRLYEIVSKHMIHGPCGVLNRTSPCMSDNRCTKKFPKMFSKDTVTANDGYPMYRRRSTEDGGKSCQHFLNSSNVEIDNRWVVPYSPLLSKTFNAHINVEYCNSVKSIKYICKYVNKGSDMAVFGVGNTVEPIDEITQYRLGRYISSNEAVWRILSFPIHERKPAVTHLAVHLENGQRVCFTSANVSSRVESPPNTTLIAFFSLCSEDTFAKELLYSEVPKFYTWNKTTNKFQRRKRGTPVPGHRNVFSTDALGRLYTVHPNHSECYHLRLLLTNVRGPTSFENLRTVNGRECDTYRQACQELNLLENDAHWQIALSDAENESRPAQIRILFAIILTICHPSNPPELWEKFKDSMSEDILHRLRVEHQNPTMQYRPEIYNEALVMIEDICLSITNQLLAQLGMPAPNRSAIGSLDYDLQKETRYNSNDLLCFVHSNLGKLNPEQRSVYDRINNEILNQRGGFYFLDAPGGTGKTFLISLILANVRSHGDIALAIASSGIAATLLDGGRTAHSALKLPLNFHNIEQPTCNISRSSGMGRVLRTCKIIIWDECPMAHKKALEALNRTLKDIRGNEQLFGGALILLAGDFRQTLPVIPRSTPADELNACLKKSSELWRYVQTLSLKTNMRVQLQNDTSATQFAKQLLDIGNGLMPIDVRTNSITFPTDFCTLMNNKEQLIEQIFPNIAQNYKNHQWLSERAILAAKNNDVNAINSSILDEMSGELLTFKSFDTVVHQDEAVTYPTEFLNSLDLPGVPPHILTLKIGAVIILLRNIHPPKLCNGTRLTVKKIMNNVIEATILNSKFKGEEVLLPRVPIFPTDMPFEFKRVQFPVRLAFAMTINKAQGQSMKVCGINLENDCFSHGQLYVACSRVGNPSDLFVYAPGGKTKNIVYQAALK